MVSSPQHVRKVARNRHEQPLFCDEEEVLFARSQFVEQGRPQERTSHGQSESLTSDPLNGEKYFRGVGNRGLAIRLCASIREMSGRVSSA